MFALALSRPSPRFTQLLTNIMSSLAAPAHNIVIVGGGIIGCTTAYYLATHPAFDARTTTITVLEASRHGAAQGASGKAGGLVAKWAYPAELVDVSFAEHVRLAALHDGAARWGWRFVNCGSWEGRGEPIDTPSSGVGARRSLEKTRGLPAGKPRAARALPDDLDWVREDLTDAYAPMTPPGDTAQVHPYLFTTSMLALAQARGVRFVRGRATAVHVSPDKAVTGVAYAAADASTQTLPARHVVVAAGAWAPALVPALPISGTRAHSITVRPPAGARVAPYVLFTEIAQRGRARAAPELYARPDGEVYCCGPGDAAPLPPTVDDVPVDADACESIYAHVAGISDVLRGGTVERRQACFLPVARGGGPIVGEASSVARGLVVATGHTCWGICNAPGTAKAVAELVLEGKISCADLEALDPARYL